MAGLAANTFTHKNAEEETTEWEDILVSKGIITSREQARRDREAAEEACEEIIERIEEAFDPLDTKSAGQIDRLLDGERIGEGSVERDKEGEELFDDDRMLLEYRKKRMAELKARAGKERFGQLVEIRRAEYEQQVTEASKEFDGTWVVLLLYVGGMNECDIMEKCLLALAPKHKATKFLKIKSTDCIPKYPDRNCPSLLFYHKGEQQRMTTTLKEYGGKGMTAMDLEWKLAEYGALKTDMDENPRAKKQSINFHFAKSSLSPGSMAAKAGFVQQAKIYDDDDDDDEW